MNIKGRGRQFLQDVRFCGFSWNGGETMKTNQFHKIEKVDIMKDLLAGITSIKENGDFCGPQILIIFEDVAIAIDYTDVEGKIDNMIRFMKSKEDSEIVFYAFLKGFSDTSGNTYFSEDIVDASGVDWDFVCDKFDAELIRHNIKLATCIQIYNYINK